MKILILLTIGFSKKLNTVLDKYTLISHKPVNNESSPLTPYEYTIKCKKIVSMVDIILVNLIKPFLDFDESLLLTLAYTNNVPIIGVGSVNNDFTLNAVITRRFASLDEAIKHLKDNY